MQRQAGLSQLPYAMGEPVNPVQPTAAPQAGLMPPQNFAPPPVPQTMMDMQTASPSAPPPMTMSQRASMILRMQESGMSREEILAQMAQVAPLTPAVEAEVEEAFVRPGLGEVFMRDSRGLAESWMTGTGAIARAAGNEETGDAFEAAGEAMFGLTPEEQEARARAAAEDNFGRDVADAVVGGALPSFAAMGAAGYATGKIGAAAGTVVGGPVGTAVGGTIGAVVGALAVAIPMSIGGAQQRAEENGADINDPEVQREILLTGTGRAVLESIGPSVVASKVLGPVANRAVQRTLSSRAMRDGSALAVIEGSTEVIGELIEIAVFDPEVRAALTEGEVAELAPLVLERHGRAIAISFLAGGAVGGAAGGASATFEQNRTNAQRKRDVEALGDAATSGGLDIAALEAAAADPTMVPILAQGARDLGAANRAVQQADAVLQAASAQGDPAAISEAQSRLEAATKAAETAYDSVIPKLGGLSSEQVRTQREVETQRAATEIVDAGLAAPDALSSLPSREVNALAAELRAARERVTDAETNLTGSNMYEASARKEAQRELKSAQAALQKTQDSIAIRTGKETAESLKQKAKTGEETAQYEAATTRQFDRKFKPLIDAGDTKAVQREANKIIKADKTNPDKGLNAEIKKLETQLDKATSTKEMDAIEAQIAEKQARLGRRAPIVAAAQRALATVNPQQAAAPAQGTSPATANNAAPQPATTGATTVGPQATPGAGPQSQPEATAAPAGVVASATGGTQTPPVTAPQGAAVEGAPDTVAPTNIDAEADRVMNRIAQLSGVQRRFGEGSDVRKAAGLPVNATPAQLEAAGVDPAVVAQERADRAELGLNPDAAPTEVVDAMKREYDLADKQEKAIGAARKAQTSRRQAEAAKPEPAPKVDPKPKVAAKPEPTPAPQPDPTPAAPTQTRAQAEAEARAEVDAETTQQRLDREYMNTPAPVLEANKTVGPDGVNGYVDLTGVLGRRTVTPGRAQAFVLEQGARLGGMEVMVAFDPATGEVLGAGTTNRKNEVHPSKAVIERLKAGQPVQIVHNHPSNNTMSYNDVAFLYNRPGDTTLTAVGADGTIFTVKPTEAGRKLFGDRKNRTKLKQHMDAVNAGYKAAMSAQIAAGTVATDPATGRVSQEDIAAVWRGTHRALWRAMSNEGLLNYRETGKNVTLTRPEMTAYDNGVKDARKAIRNAFALSATRNNARTGSRSGAVQRPSTVRSGRSAVGDSPSRNPARDGDRLGDGPAGPDAGRDGVAAVQPGRGGRGIVARRATPNDAVDGVPARRVYDLPDGTSVYEVRDPAGFTSRVETAKATMGPLGAQVGSDPGTRQFLFNDGMSGFALDGDNIISVFTSPGAPSGVIDTVLSLGVDQGGRRLDAFDTFLPRAYAGRGFKAVARLPFSREYAPDGWDYNFYDQTFGNSDPDVVFMVYDPTNATSETDNVIADYDDGIAAQTAEIEAVEGAALAEAAAPEPFTEAETTRIRQGAEISRQNRWQDISTQIPAEMTAAAADAEVFQRGQADGYEYSIQTDQYGRVIGAGTNRHNNAVASSMAAQSRFVTDQGPWRITHNHPKMTPLSPADVMIVFEAKGDFEIAAVLPDQSVETAKAGPNMQEFFADRYGIAGKVSGGAYTHLLPPGTTVSPDTHVLAATATNKLLADAGIIEYTPGNITPDAAQLKGAYDAALEAVTAAYPNVRERIDSRTAEQQDGSQAPTQGPTGPEAVRARRPSPASPDRDSGAAGPVDRLAESTPPDMSPEQFLAVVEAASQRLQTRKALATRLAERDGGVRFHGTPGRMAAVTKGTYGDKKWRVTYMDERGPSGHSDFNSKYDAVYRALEDGYTPATKPADRPTAEQQKPMRENLPPEFYDLQDKFDKAFPETAIRGADGKPMLLWHGSKNAGFTAFDTDSLLSGIFMTPSAQTAAAYADDAAPVRFRPQEGAADGPTGRDQQFLANPDLRDRFEIDVKPVGRFVSASDLLDSGVDSRSLWWASMFPEGVPNLAPMSDAAVQDAIDQGVVTQQQIDAATKDRYYTATYDGFGRDEPEVYVEASEFLGSRETRERLSQMTDGEVERGGTNDGQMYPLFAHADNPIEVDWGGQQWNEGPVYGYEGKVGGDAIQLYADDFGGDIRATKAAVEGWVDQQMDKLVANNAETLKRIDPNMPEAELAQTLQSYRERIFPSVVAQRPFPTTDSFVENAFENGHDMVIFRNIIDGGYSPTDVFVAADPTQAKHAFDNDGTFDAFDPNMLSDNPMPDNQRDPVHKKSVENLKAAEVAAKRRIEVPAWLDVQTEHGSAVKEMLDRARDPVGTGQNVLKWMEQQVVNAFTPIRDLELNQKGRLGVGLDSAFKSAEIAVNDSGRNEMLMFYGAASLGADNQFKPARGTIGIRPMLDKLGGGQQVIDWMSYMGARRAQEIRAKGLKTPLTDKDIAAGMALENPVFKEVAADWKRFNDANVDFLVQTGRISPALAATLKADAAYIPFYRTDETVNNIPDLYDEAGIKRAAKGGGAVGGQILSRDPGIKRLKGGEVRKVDNLVNNMIKNSQAMVAAGMRNRAANLTFDLMTDTGYVEVIPAQTLNDKGQYVSVAAPRDAVRMWKNGKEKYIVPKTADAIPLIVAMGGLAPVRLQGIAAGMAKIGSFFRQSITLSPSFMVRNMIRDTVSTGVLFSGRNLTMDNNSLKGFHQSLRNSSQRQAFTAMSGMGDFRFGGNDIGLGRNDMMIEMGVMTPTMGSRFRQVIGKLEEYGTASELSNRIAVMDSLVKSGVRPDEAAYQALTIVNYGRKGSNQMLRTLLPLVPFLNARIQGLARIVEDATAKRGKDRTQAIARLALNGSVLAAASALLWGWNNSDEERREKYEAEPLHRRLNYHIFYAGDKKVMIPKAFEIGTMFGTIPELFMEAAIQGDTEELGTAAVQTLVNTFSFNPIPAALMPAIEIIADYNFFTGRPIEGQRLQSRMREDRVTPQTSALATALARTGVASFAGLSPVMIDHLLAGYGGVAYTSTATMVDTVAGEMGWLPSKPEGVFGTIPVVSPMIATTFGSMFKDADGDASNKFVEDFYAARQGITQIYNSARDAALAGDVERARWLLAQAPATPAAYKIVNRAGVRLGEISTALRQVRSGDMSPQQKRQTMTQLINERNRIATEVMKVIKAAEEQQGTSFRRAAAG